MPKEPKKPSRGPSPEPSRGGRKGRRGNPDKLVPGVKPGQERGPDGKLLPKEVPEPVGAELSTDAGDDLAAMEHVWTNPEDRTHQHRSFRAMKEASPREFWDRMQSLRKERDAAKPSQKLVDGCWEAAEWDGSGPCPTCNREPERPLEDPTTDSIIKMIDRLTEDKGVA